MSNHYRSASALPNVCCCLAPALGVELCLWGLASRPLLTLIRVAQHGRDEAVIPGVTAHKRASNLQNYTNLVWT